MKWLRTLFYMLFGPRVTPKKIPQEWRDHLREKKDLFSRHMEWLKDADDE